MLATHPDPVPAFRGRIGQDPRSGYHAVPHRYRLYLTPSCPECLRIAVTHDLLGMGDTLPVTLLPALPDTADGGHGALRPLYEAGSHRHPGPALAPVLGDDWTGRIVSTHAPDILRDGADGSADRARHSARARRRRRPRRSTGSASGASPRPPTVPDERTPTPRPGTPRSPICSPPSTAWNGGSPAVLRPRLRWRTHRRGRAGLGHAGVARHRARPASGRRRGAADRRAHPSVGLRPPTDGAPRVRPPPRPGRHHSAPPRRVREHRRLRRGAENHATGGVTRGASRPRTTNVTA